MDNKDLVKKIKDTEIEFLNAVGLLIEFREKRTKKLIVTSSNANLNLNVAERCVLFANKYKSEKDVNVFSMPGGFLLITPVNEKENKLNLKQGV